MQELDVGAVDLGVGEARSDGALDEICYRGRAMRKNPEVGKVFGWHEYTGGLISICSASNIDTTR